MTDRYNILSQMEHLQSKYMGTGHADATKFEWATHQHRFILYGTHFGHHFEPWSRVSDSDSLLCLETAEIYRD
jgi:hypothetical protein